MHHDRLVSNPRGELFNSNTNRYNHFNQYSVVGVVVSIRDSHSRDPGSIPGRRIFLPMWVHLILMHLGCLQSDCEDPRCIKMRWDPLSRGSLMVPYLYFVGQSLLTYLLLAVTYLSLFCCQKTQQRQSLWSVVKSRGIRYFFLAVVDVEANYLLHRAFHYTTLTSVQVSSNYQSISSRTFTTGQL